MSGRIAVLASGVGSNAEALAEACEQGRIDGRLCVVASNRPEAAVLARASARGLPTLALDHRAYPDRATFDAALHDALANFEPDLVVLAGFMRILSPAFITPWRGRLINIHPSLLPRYPGLDTHARALAAGDREAGATVHFVIEALDAGPAILQARVPVEVDDNPERLAARVQEEEHRIYPLAVQACLSGRVRLAGDRAELLGRPLPPAGADPAALAGR
ncbi:phosphoribosylglycinamide formyltransferase [Pseudohaliea rubra]|uniref:Phosphoribosylglycinamide formyltransferase n=1 Tax=Pseudohaliea rubra DSM 19751 TaxID=1265313 RepID=A0A095VW44_9GAMM|nr:phosphoribosylglycinamide formyltransferase [Pseudohaliea rubra]KGE05273.1 Phosphoribosylglycinamide formyltransferase [Pseudohaliea rubra DSM 19751]